MRIFLTLLLSITISACVSFPAPTATPLPVIGDSFFFGLAVLDANGNGQIDSADTPLPGATFIARDARGAEFGGVTNSDGRATVSFPGGSVYPVTLRMQQPKGSNLALVAPTEIILNSASGNNGKFLFAMK